MVQKECSNIFYFYLHNPGSLSMNEISHNGICQIQKQMLSHFSTLMSITVSGVLRSFWEKSQFGEFTACYAVIVHSSMYNDTAKKKVQWVIHLIKCEVVFRVHYFEMFPYPPLTYLDAEIWNIIYIKQIKNIIFQIHDVGVWLCSFVLAF